MVSWHRQELQWRRRGLSTRHNSECSHWLAPGGRPRAPHPGRSRHGSQLLSREALPSTPGLGPAVAGHCVGPSLWRRAAPLRFGLVLLPAPSPVAPAPSRRWLRHSRPSLCPTVQRSAPSLRPAVRPPAVTDRAVRYNAPCRGVAQPGSAPALGAGGRRFKSCRPDHYLHRNR